MLRYAIPLASLLAAAVTGPAAGKDAWQVQHAPSNNPDLMAAATTNADGHTLYVWRLEDEAGSQIFCEMHLADGVAFAGDMPVFRIDGAAAVDTAEIRDAGDARNALWAHVGESVAFWLVSEPGRVSASDPDLRPWLSGREVQISFVSADGTEHTTRFSLVGSGQAIRSATGLAAR